MKLSSFFYLILLISCLLIPIQQSHGFFFDFDFDNDNDYGYYRWNDPYYNRGYNSYSRYRYNPYRNHWNNQSYQTPYDCTCTCQQQNQTAIEPVDSQ